MLRIFSMFQGVQRLYAQRVSGVSLGIFRITYSLVLFGEVLQLYLFRHLSFDPIPYLVPAELDLGPVLLAWLLVIACLVLGLFTRTATIVNYVLTLATFSVFTGMEYHYDYAIVAVNLMLLFMPVSARLSLDRLLEQLRWSSSRSDYSPDSTVPSVYAYLMLFVGVAFVYTDSIFWKLTSPMWRGGLGMWLPASTPYVTWLDLSPFLDRELLVKLLGYTTLVFEATFFVLMWFRRTHPVLFFVGIGLHLGIFVAFPIPWFGLGFVALYLLLVPDTWYRAFGRWLRHKDPVLTLYCDGESGSCQLWRRIVKHFDVRRALELREVQQQAVPVAALGDRSPESLLSELHGVDATGHVLVGFEAHVRVLSLLGFTWPIAQLLRVPPLSWLGRRVYAHVKSHPHRSTGSSQVIRPPFSQIMLELRPLKVAGLSAFLLFCVASQLVAIFQSPLVGVAMRKAGAGSVYESARAAAAKYTEVTRIVAGITRHGVFMDRHFRGYDHVVAVAYVDPAGQETWLPIIDRNGQASLYDTGRQFVQWTFRACGPELDPEKVSNGIRSFTAFWAHEHGVSLANATFRVRVKRIQVAQHWEPGFLERQLQRPWLVAGDVHWKNAVFHESLPDLEKL